MKKFSSVPVFGMLVLCVLISCSSADRDQDPEMIFRDADLSLLSDKYKLEASGIHYRTPKNWAAKDSLEFHIEQLIRSQPGLHHHNTYSSIDDEQQMVVGYYDISADSVNSWLKASAETFSQANPASPVAFDSFRHNNLQMANLMYMGDESVLFMLMADRSDDQTRPASVIFIFDKQTYQENLHTIESIVSTLEVSG